MKNNTSKKNKSNIFNVKNRYCISLENASKRTQGGCGTRVESVLLVKTFSHPSDKLDSKAMLIKTFSTI